MSTMLEKARGQLARRGALVVLAAVGALCGGASSAMAATVGGSADAPVFISTAGVDNVLTVTQTAPNKVRFHDDAESITSATLDCAPDSSTPGDVICAAGGLLGAITINLGDGNDQTTLVDVAGATTQNGGDGDDSLNGGDGSDTLNGGDGSDLLSGADGADHLDGGAGDDDAASGGGLDGGAGADDIHGGDGVDLVINTDTRDQTLTLDDSADDGFAGEGDNVHSDVEKAATNTGNDTLVGSGADNLLFGDEGNDTITGGAGQDVLVGAGGNDVIRARDGIADTIACGSGTDEVFADAIDVLFDDPDPAVSDHCENVHLPAATGGSGGAGSTPPPAATTSATGTATGTGTAIASGAAPTDPRLAPRSVSMLVAARDSTRPYRFTIRGAVSLPAGVTKATACAAGSVKVTGRRGLKIAFAKTARLRRDCTYSVTATITRRGRVKITARFSGNGALTAKSSLTRTVRAG
jgi:Ca2+-binding RTX toxin-like protein